ncbi:MAG TPA: hypothetical protein VGK40_08020 [Verrucomicrobiae bacterium]
MKILCLIVCSALLAGCTGTHRKGVSRNDAYDAMTIDQMVGNNVSRAVFEKTIVCLNARRESRRVTTVTNVAVTMVTNVTVNAITNQTISIATNVLAQSMTNLASVLTALTPAPGEPGFPAPLPLAVETNVAAALPIPAPTAATNVSVSVQNNQSATTAPNQIAANNQLIRSYNTQITVTSNNISISVMNNLVVTTETNQIVAFVTNSSVVSVTNVVISPTNQFVHEYFLYTELTPPPEFTLATGESLILLVDGARYGFSPAQSGTAFIGRKGYTSTLYRVPLEVLVAIANAKEVKARFKGSTSVIERTMNTSSKQHFREFLLKYLSPPPAPAAPKQKVALAGDSSQFISY